MALLELDQVAAGYGRRLVLEGVSLAVGAGEVVALLGRNGAGKTTLLRVAAGILRPRAGRVLVEGEDLARLAVRAAARLVAGVAQDDAIEFAFTVRDVVALGRYAHRTALGPEGAGDRAAVEEALAVTGLADLAARPVTELSGGERRRASLARCLAQDAAVMLLDEPTAHVDLGHETRILDTVRDRARTRGKAVVAALHDVNLAATFADRIVLLEGGRVAAQGTPDAVLTSERLSALYDVPVEVLRLPGRDDLFVRPGRR